MLGDGETPTFHVMVSSHPTPTTTILKWMFWVRVMFVKVTWDLQGGPGPLPIIQNGVVSPISRGITRRQTHL